MKEKRVNARLDPSLWAAFYRALRANGMTFTGWLRSEAAKFVKKHEEK